VVVSSAVSVLERRFFLVLIIILLSMEENMNEPGPLESTLNSSFPAKIKLASVPHHNVPGFKIISIVVSRRIASVEFRRLNFRNLPSAPEELGTLRVYVVSAR